MCSHACSHVLCVRTGVWVGMCEHMCVSVPTRRWDVGVTCQALPHVPGSGGQWQAREGPWCPWSRGCTGGTGSPGPGQAREGAVSLPLSQAAAPATTKHSTALHPAPGPQGHCPCWVSPAEHWPSGPRDPLVTVTGRGRRAQALTCGPSRPGRDGVWPQGPRRALPRGRAAPGDSAPSQERAAEGPAGDRPGVWHQRVLAAPDQAHLLLPHQQHGGPDGARRVLARARGQGAPGALLPSGVGAASLDLFLLRPGRRASKGTMQSSRAGWGPVPDAALSAPGARSARVLTPPLCPLRPRGPSPLCTSSWEVLAITPA